MRLRREYEVTRIYRGVPGDFLYSYRRDPRYINLRAHPRNEIRRILSGLSPYEAKWGSL